MFFFFLSVSPIILLHYPLSPEPVVAFGAVVRAHCSQPPPAARQTREARIFVRRRRARVGPSGACSLTPRAEILIYVAQARAADNNDGGGGARRSSLLDEALLITPPLCRYGTARGPVVAAGEGKLEAGADGSR